MNDKSGENNPYIPEPAPASLPATGVTTIITNIFTAPSIAMMQVKERYSIMIPLLLVAALTGLVMFLYFQMVDFDWYVDYMVEVSAGDLSKAEQNQMRQGLEMFSPNTMGIMVSISGLLGVALVYVIHAAYFVIISNIVGDEYEFKQWLSFVSWASLPGVLAIIAMFALLFSSSNGQIAIESLNPLTLNELFFGLDSSKGLGKLLASIHLPQIWGMVVMVIGYQTWTKKSMGISSAIVLGPFLLIYGIWFLMI